MVDINWTYYGDHFELYTNIESSCCIPVVLSPCLFNLYAEHIIWNTRLDKAQAGIKIAGKNISNLRYADDTTIMAESEELKSLLMKVKEKSEKAGLEFNIHKMKIMTSGPITSWQTDGETMGKVSVVRHTAFFMGHLSHPYMTTGKTTAVTRWTFVSKVMSLLFNVLSSFSSKEQVSFNIMAAVTTYSDFGTQETKVCHCFHCLPICLPWSDGTGCHDLNFWNVEFKPTFSLSSFSSRGSSVPVHFCHNGACLRLLIFLPAILIPACAASSLALLMMYSADELNKQGDNIQPWCTPFPIWNQSVVPCPVLTVASWPAYRFLRRQVRLSGISISFRIYHRLLWSKQSKALA